MVRQRVIREQRRKDEIDKMPTRVVEPAAVDADGDRGSGAAAAPGYVVSHDLSPATIQEMFDAEHGGGQLDSPSSAAADSVDAAANSEVDDDDGQQPSPSGRENDEEDEDGYYRPPASATTASAAAARDGETTTPSALADMLIPTIDSHDAAKAAYAARVKLGETLASKRSDRQEARARWLLWQASQREKGFEARVRRKLDKQRASQRHNVDRIAGRLLTAGAGAAADFERHRLVEEEREHKAAIVDPVRRGVHHAHPALRQRSAPIADDEDSNESDYVEFDGLASKAETEQWESVKL